MTLAQSTRYKLYQPVVLTDQFVVTFPIFATQDITVYVDGVVETLYTINATFLNGRATNAQIVLNTPVTDVDVEIYGTRSPRRENNYLGNSPSLSDNLQNDVDAVTAVQQEQSRDFSTSLRTSAGAPPVSPLPGDAAARADRTIKFTADGLGIENGPNASDITEAQNHALKAKQWAEEDEDVEVETGEYSAKHYSAKSAGFATAASSSATAAANSAASVSPTQVVVVNGDRTIVIGDSNAILRPDARRILTLPSPAGFFNGFSFRVDAPFGAAVAADVGVSLTFVGRGAVGSIEVLPNQVLTVFTDGTEYFAYVSSDPLFEVVYVDPNLASVPFVDVSVPYGKRAGRFWYDRFEPTVENAYLAARVGSGGVVSTAGAYFTQPADVSTDHFILGHPTEINATPNTVSWGDGTVYGFHDPNFSPRCRVIRGGVTASATTNAFDTIGGKMPGNAATAADTIRFFSSSGNITELYLHIDWS